MTFSCVFEDLLAANKRYASRFHDPGVPGAAARELAVLTCIDSRIDPLAMLGLKPGDAKIIRNAGARVTDDSLRSLILAVNLLNAKRVMVVQHTDCAMANSDDAAIAEHASATRAAPTVLSSLTCRWSTRAAALQGDIAKIRDVRAHPVTTQVQASCTTFIPENCSPSRASRNTFRESPPP